MWGYVEVYLLMNNFHFGIRLLLNDDPINIHGDNRLWGGLGRLKLRLGRLELLLGRLELRLGLFL